MFELALQVPTFVNGGIGVRKRFFRISTSASSSLLGTYARQYVGIQQHLVTAPTTLLAHVQTGPKPA